MGASEMVVSPSVGGANSRPDAGMASALGFGSYSAMARLRFVLIFVAAASFLFAVYTYPYQEAGISERWFSAYLAAYAKVAGAIISIFEPGLHVVGQNLVGRVSLHIAKNCDAIEAEILFAAAVVAFPSSWARRSIGVVLGALAIAVVNVLRIGCLYYVRIHAPESFEFVHLQVWPLLIVGIAVAAFCVWAAWAQKATLVHADARG